MVRGFVLLGEVGIHTGDGVAAITQPRLRGLLAALLVDVNTVLSCDTLVDRVWGDDLPDHPRASLRNHVARLRVLLGDGDRTIVSLSGGYLFRADPDSVDLHRFRRLRDAGRGSEALALWSGEALSGVHTPWAEEVRTRLNAERLATRRDLVVPRQLPAAPLSFVGRHDDLKRLDAVLGGGTVAISAIAGAGGVGKTWLALRWAHDNVACFPDGQLYANLRGFDPTGEPVAATAVLRSFLHALGVPPQDIPHDEDARAALFRTVVAGRKILVVLDNARDAAQVAGLLPGGGCGVLITSRNDLGDVTGERLFVDCLSEDESRRLLAHHVGAQRLEGEPEEASKLLRYCAGLPLALSIVATRAAQHPEFPLAALSTELTDGLEALDGDDPSASLSAVLASSCRALSPRAATAFRLLGQMIGADISHAAAAALCEDPGALAELESAHLVEQHRPGRYRMHDLVLKYARDAAPDPAGTRRLLDFYLRSGQLDDEIDNIVAAGDFAAEHGWHEHAWRLANVIWYFRYTRGHSTNWVPSMERAVAAARQTADARGVATTVKNLGVALYWNMRIEEAVRCYEEALDLFAALGDDRSVSGTLNNLGAAHARLGEDTVSIAYYERALLCPDSSPETRAGALGNMAQVLARQGRIAEAEANCLRALALNREWRSDDIEGHVLGNLAIVLRAAGRFSEALDRHRRALTLLRRVNDRAGECETLNELGETLRRMRDPDAVTPHRQALTLAENMANPFEIARAREGINGG